MLFLLKISYIDFDGSELARLIAVITTLKYIKFELTREFGNSLILYG